MEFEYSIRSIILSNLSFNQISDNIGELSLINSMVTNLGFLISKYDSKIDKSLVINQLWFINEESLDRHEWLFDSLFYNAEGFIYHDNLTSEGLNIVIKIIRRNNEILKARNEILSNLETQKAGFMKIELKKLVSRLNFHNIPTITKIESFNDLLDALRNVTTEFLASPRKEGHRLDVFGHFYEYD